jgi:hypothetical protein
MNSLFLSSQSTPFPLPSTVHQLRHSQRLSTPSTELRIATLSKLTKPMGSDAEGTAPATELPAYGYLHHETSILTVAEDENDAMFVDS